MIFLKKLKVVLRSFSGRNNLGRLTMFTRGGGLKKFYTLIDWKRKILDIPAKVISVQSDSLRSANISLICYKNGFLSYILNTRNIKVGDVLYSSDKSFMYCDGDTLPLKYIQVGSMVHNVELYPRQGAIFSRSAGSFAKVWSQNLNYTHLKLSSGEDRLVRNTCRATIGVVSNEKHKFKKYFKAGIRRNLGFRPKVRGIAKNPVDHPNGGRTKGGFAFRDVWGNLSEGCRLKKNKRFKKLILNRNK